jgi:hypothetical protein
MSGHAIFCAGCSWLNILALCKKSHVEGNHEMYLMNHILLHFSDWRPLWMHFEEIK